MQSKPLLIQIIILISIFKCTQKNDQVQNNNFFDQEIDKHIKINGFKRKIGILSLPLSPTFRKNIIKKNNGKYSLQKLNKILDESSQISGIYHDFINSYAMEAISIDYNQDLESILNQLEELDGILLTGGPNLFDLREYNKDNLSYYRIIKEGNLRYLNVIKGILEKSKEINDEGRTFIVFGICLGFQGILMTESDLDIRISNVERTNFSDYIYIPKNKIKTKINKEIPKKYVKKLRNERITFFNHSLGFKVSDFRKFEELEYQYHISLTYKDENYGTCVAAIEHKYYPIYAIQFHPEKLLYDESGNYDLNKGKTAIKISAYFEKLIFAPFNLPKRSESLIPQFPKLYTQVFLKNLLNQNFYVLSKNKEIELLQNIVK